MNSYKNVDEYILTFPAEVQKKLKSVRKMIHDEVPECGEKISYGVPTATLKDKYFLYFAAYKNHISIYPVTPAIEEIKEAMEYRTGKGTLQFPLGQPIPIGLIKRIIKARLREFEE